MAENTWKDFLTGGGGRSKSLYYDFLYGERRDEKVCKMSYVIYGFANFFKIKFIFGCGCLYLFFLGIKVIIIFLFIR